MKQSDLRIGNFITDKWASEKSYFEVITVSSKYPIVKYGTNLSANIENVRGIPLTEEWLIKFGFENQDENRFWLDPVFLFHYGDGVKHLANQRHVNLFYVHQLQNLYFSITGEELTIK